MSNVRYTTIEEIIQHAIGEEDLDARSAAKLVPIAVRGWNTIYREATSEIKTEILTFPNPNIRIIDYPYDYDYYTKIGVTVTMGGGTKKIMTLSRDQYMYKPTNADIVTANCTCDSTTTAEDLAAIRAGSMPFPYYSVFQNAFRGGQFVGELFGAGGGESSAGSYITDDINGRFVFSSDIPTSESIVLEYKRVATTDMANTRIPLYATEAMIAWVKWKMLNMRNSGIGERKFAQIRYEEEVYKLYEQQVSLTGSEILDELYQGAGFIHN